MADPKKSANRKSARAGNRLGRTDAAQPAAAAPRTHAPAFRTSLPAMRRMSVVAQDPSVRGAGGRILMAEIDVPAEDLLPGPIGHRVQVVDYDASTGRYRGAHVLPASIQKEPKAWRDGDPAILKNYRFHAQNTYALVMKTLARFEFALGRRVSWSFGVHQLKVAPNGFMDANAFYSRNEEGLVLGYFPGRSGKTIHTCLSHDVIVHETTHALLDALRERYLDPSGPDQAAFHEGFADVIALLSVFSQVELVAELLRRGGSKATRQGYISDRDVTAAALRKTALFGLADEMGAEVQAVRGDALRRSVKLEPSRTLLSDPEFAESHRRGEILVAAVMNGFIEAWTERLDAAKSPGQQLHALWRVAEEGSDIASALATMWIRALDYMPPVHMEFGDALSAAITADMEVRPDDSRFELRRHMLQSFSAYGIRPASKARDRSPAWGRPAANLNFDRVRFESMRTDKDEVFRFIWENQQNLHVEPGVYTEVLSVRPCLRIGPDGFTLRETVAEYYQVARLTPQELRQRGITLPREYVAALQRERREADKRRAQRLRLDEEAYPPDEDLDSALTTPVYGGGALIFDEFGKLKYEIYNEIFGERQTQRLQYLWSVGELRAGRKGAQLSTARLSAMHRYRAIDARRSPMQGW